MARFKGRTVQNILSVKGVSKIMVGISIKKLARNMGLSPEVLIDKLQELGVEVETKDDLVSGEQQLILLQSKLLSRDIDQKKNISVSDIENAKSLSELNGALTLAMASRTIQSLIKGDGLKSVIDSILNLIKTYDDELTAASIFGRLAAVAQKRESIVFEEAEKIFSSEPDTIDTLPDGSAKLNAATIISRISNTWVSEYSYREVFRIDTADKARKKLLSASLNREKNIARWLENISEHAKELNNENNPETRVRRAKRISSIMRDIADSWHGDVGENVGEKISECLTSFLPEHDIDFDPDNLYDALDCHLAILKRIIELRFSSALYPSTYAILIDGKRYLGSGVWRQYISQSNVLPTIRIALLESALVLARQNRSDRQIMAALAASYNSRTQVSSAIKKHFHGAEDLDPDVADWWKGDEYASGKRSAIEQKVGNTEDSQIGILLIEVDSNREAMEKVGGTVVPLLAISEPVLSSTVKKAVNGYKNIEQTVRRLARMRKLSKPGLKGKRLEYNPLEHEMLGGHKSGVRQVKVIRDGIQKDFSGKVKTLVKPWVEPE